jgi:all-trans-retinol dehydrogenase (NAD+)
MLWTILLALVGLIIICSVYYHLTYPKRDIRGQLVLVTGAGHGLGRLQSILYARLGCRLVLWDINEAGLEETRKQLPTGSSATTAVVNVMDRSAVYAAAEAAGPVDILVNNAGIVTGKRLLDLTDAEIDRTMAINTTAHFWTIKAFLPGMIARGYGHIVAISSQAGLFGAAQLTDYCASKHAVTGLMEALASEMEDVDADIRTTTVCPMFISTGMFAGASNGLLGPVLSPERVAERIVEGVQRSEERVDLPGFMRLAVALTRLLPVKGQKRIMWLLGAQSAMRNFKPG